MAKFKLDGLDKLINRVDEMGQATEHIKQSAISNGADMALNQLKQDAPKRTGKSAANLTKIESRSGKGYLFIDVGIGKRNWQETKGLYFQHYGFKSKSKTLWMTAAFKRAKRKISKQIKDKITKGLKL